MAHALVKLRFPVQIEDRLLFGRQNTFESPGILGDFLLVLQIEILREFVEIALRVCHRVEMPVLRMLARGRAVRRHVVTVT